MLDEKKIEAQSFIEDHEAEILLGGSTLLSVLALIGGFFLYRKAISAGVRDGIVQATSR